MTSDIINKKKQLDEIRRCGKDPVYFFNTYVKISHPVKGPIPFRTFPFQDDCVQEFLENRFVIVNKSRQLGLSTLTAAYATWLALFHKNKEVLVIATKLDVAQNFISKVKHVLRSLPKWLVLPKVTTDNKQVVEFGSPSGSKIKAVPTSEDAGRSEALSLLIVDEAAHIRNFDELWKGLYSTLSTGGRAIVISTPKGVGNKFHELWEHARAGANEFKWVELPWQVHPEHDNAWFENEKKNMSKRQVAQELECDFLASGETYMSPDDIDFLVKNTKPPSRREGSDMNVWVWADNIVGCEYIVSADVGRGDKDFSGFHVINSTTGEQVAEYKGRIRPDVLGELLFEYGTRYNNAVIAVEKNSYGFHTLVTLVNKGYKNIYIGKKDSVFMGDYIPAEAVHEAGFDTNGSTRPKIMAKLEEVVRNKQLRVYSSRLTDELKTFVTINNKPQAMRGSNDDLVMSMAIGIWLFDVSSVHSQFVVQLNKAMLSCFSRSSNDFENMQGNGNEVIPSWVGMLPYSGAPGPNPTSRKVRPDDPSDMSWLFSR